MSDNGASFSWGVKKDLYGTIIDADTTSSERRTFEQEGSVKAAFNSDV